MFSSVMVIGLGLIGGSIAAAAHALDDAPVVYGVDTDSVTLAYAIEMHAVDAAAQADEAIASGWLSPGTVDLVVLATPARDVGPWLDKLARAGYDGIVTDVASTKRCVMSAAKKHASGAFAFVGGHPMAGSERSGIQASSPELFRGAYYVLTPTDATDADAFRQVHEFVTALGARAITVPAEAHDEAVALISHVPHVTAAALVALASARSGGGQDALRLAAGGFKDMTRVAAGSPELWTGICLDNAEPLVTGLAELRHVLEDFAVAVMDGDAEAVHAWFSEAADVRRSLPAQWVPATTALTELSLPMIDRPGQVSEITTAVGRAGCNIEDIEIDHETEDSATLRLVLTDEGDYDGLIGALESLGYEPRMRKLG